jgi:hypothetical protein
MHRLQVDDKGWVIGATTYDGVEPEGVKGYIHTSEDVALHAKARGVLYRHEDGTLALSQDDRELWKHLRARGHQGPEALERVEDLRRLRKLITTDVAVEAGPAQSYNLFTLDNLPYDFADVPGLRVRHATTQDLEVVSQSLIESGQLPATCPDGDCVPAEAHAFLTLAKEWDRGTHAQFVLEWNGRILQFESMFVDGLHGLTSGRTWHVTRERPHWFWKEAWRPIAEGLMKMGHNEMRGLLRRDLDLYGKSLESQYNAKRTKSTPQIVIEYSLDKIPFNGFPKRREVPEFRFQGVIVKSIEPDLAVESLVQGKRNSIARKILYEVFHLDRGAVIQISNPGGETIAIRTVKERNATKAQISHLSPLKDDPQNDVASLAALDWMRRAGYSVATRFVPDSIKDSPLEMRSLEREGFVMNDVRLQFSGGIAHYEAQVQL